MRFYMNLKRICLEGGVMLFKFYVIVWCEVVIDVCRSDCNMEFSV